MKVVHSFETQETISPTTQHIPADLSPPLYTLLTTFKHASTMLSYFNRVFNYQVAVAVQGNITVKYLYDYWRYMPLDSDFHVGEFHLI